MKIAPRLAVGLLTIAASVPAHAVTSFDPTNFSAFTQDAVNALVKTVGYGADHHDYMPASPLGTAFGLDIGIDATVIDFPSDFLDAMATATGSSASELPPRTVVPRLNIHKGLPLGIDLGFSYVGYATSGKSNTLLGFSGQWNFLKAGKVRPPISFRFSYSKATVPAFFMTSTTYKTDLVVSRKLGVFAEPYFGLGMQFASGTLEIPSSAIGLPVAVSNASSQSGFHFFVGFPINLVFLKLTPEYDYNLSGVRNYGGKISFSF